MITRRTTAWLAAVSLIAGLTASAQAARLLSAASRLEHGRQNFDLALPLDASGIEPRALRDGMTLVLKFDAPVQELTVRAEQARAARPLVQGNVATVTLMGVINGREVRLWIDGKNVEPRQLAFRTLRGDVNGDARVTEADARLVQQFVGQPLTPATARYDVVASGRIDSTDVGRVRAWAGERADGGPIRNTPPTISRIPDQKSTVGRVPPGIGFQIHDAETPAEQLMVWACSETPDLLSDKHIQISGEGELRVLTAQPISGRTGVAQIRVTVYDGIDSASTAFAYEFENSPQLFIAQMTPQGGAQTLGSGNATLILAADELSATLRFSYSNLTGPETAAHVHGPGAPGVSAGILFDIDTATPNPDGSYTWTFEPVGGHSVQDQVNFIRQGLTYINVHTAAYPNGEI
ncbi:MAG: CHRD domain-containing protein, partial [Phycisphaerae bacterium]|nr:CHRD domain-containing protein [Phycisphaerae bacterium]